MHARSSLAALALLAVAACGGDKAGSDTAARGADTARTAASGTGAPAACPAGDNGGLTLPAGFCATVFADSIGHARHIAIAPSGVVYVNTWSGAYYNDEGKARSGGFVVVLRDTTRDGKADVVQRFGGDAKGNGGGTGIALYDGYVYADAGRSIVRYKLAGDSLTASGNGEVVVSGFPDDGDHPHHNFVIDSSGTMYSNMGSRTNSCQQRNRTEGSKGIDPCVELATRAGIWKWDARKAGQTFGPNNRFATGLRNAVGLSFGPDGALYATQHGRDQLAENWKPLYTPEQGQENPAEEIVRVTQGADFGWPYCYFDKAQGKLVLAPEYGGDGGKQVGRCEKATAPVAAFPAHWAPNDLVFYRGTQFPEQYRNGAFVAFHGSWNRAPGPQGGYEVAFVRPGNGQTETKYEDFAKGFGGSSPQPTTATYRPAGLAVGPDGALYISDDVKGRIWRVTYGGR